MDLKINLNSRHTQATNLASMQETGELCDFNVIVGNTKIQAHKCILAASCEYFRTSFNFSPTSGSASDTDLTHLGCNVETVEKVIKSFYTQTLSLESCDVEAVLRLADFLMCEEIKQEVEGFMQRTLSFPTATLYFQLALQYQLNTTDLFRNAQYYLWFRFHDYFIYQPEALDSSPEVVQAFQQYRLFHFCSPLQVMVFLLNNLKRALVTAQLNDDCSEEFRDERISQTFQLILTVFDNIEITIIRKWRYYLIRFIKEWYLKAVTLKEFSCVNDLVLNIHERLESEIFSKDKIFERRYNSDPENILNMPEHCPLFCESNKTKINDVSNTITCITSRDNSDISGKITTTSTNSQTTQHTANEHVLSTAIYTQMDTSVSEAACSSATKSQCLSTRTHSPNELIPENTDSTNNNSSVVRESSLQLQEPANLEEKFKTKLCEVVVLLAPSAEMASQVNDVDAGKSWPLVSHPQLELALYDVELGTWRSGGRLDFPISGPMQDRHSWRTAAIHGNLYMFSLVKSVGLEYEIMTKKWTFLKCSELFTPHNENSPIKSIIPIAVGSKLIVLSMSRELKTDGTFGTQQNFYELVPSTNTFILAATVRDDQMDLPITQWTVLGDTLVTVKASTMMYRHLSRVQYIHQFNSSNSVVKTHNAVCAMESGIKVLLKGDTVYLLDKEGWCRSFSLTTSEWTGQTRYPMQTLASMTGNFTQDSVYPALTRVTCHAGGSRWEVSCSISSCSAYMEEVRVSEDGVISTHQHPPPPCHFGTALCPGFIDRKTLDRLEQGCFEYCDSKNS